MEPTEAESASAGSDILSIDSIVLEGSASTKEGAITEAGQLLVAAGAVDESYVEAMHERERSVSTYMGNLLALPHGTNEAKDAVKRSTMSFVRYPEGIDWNGNPVKFVVGIAGANNTHLEILQRVAITFSNLEQVDKLEKAGSVQEIIDILKEA